MISRLMFQFFYLLFVLLFHADIGLQSILPHIATITEWNAPLFLPSIHEALMTAVVKF